MTKAPKERQNQGENDDGIFAAGSRKLNPAVKIPSPYRASYFVNKKNSTVFRFAVILSFLWCFAIVYSSFSSICCGWFTPRFHRTNPEEGLSCTYQVYNCKQYNCTNAKKTDTWSYEYLDLPSISVDYTSRPLLFCCCSRINSLPKNLCPWSQYRLKKARDWNKTSRLIKDTRKEYKSFRYTSILKNIVHTSIKK